jgi:hypothetical protein
MNFRGQQEEVDSLKGNFSIGEISELQEQMKRQYEDQLKRVTDMVFLNSLDFTDFPCALVEDQILKWFDG